MTTIAYKDGILAADNQLTIDNIKTKCTKICRLTPSRVIACAGNTDDEAKAHKYFSLPDYKDFEPPTVKKSFCCILIIGQEILACESKLYPMKIEHPFYAIGSGWQIAMASMHAGSSAYDAVKFTHELDIYTGDEIEIFHVKDNEEEKKVRKPKATS